MRQPRGLAAGLLFLLLFVSAGPASTNVAPVPTEDSAIGISVEPKKIAPYRPEQLSGVYAGPIGYLEVMAIAGGVHVHYDASWECQGDLPCLCAGTWTAKPAGSAYRLGDSDVTVSIVEGIASFSATPPACGANWPGETLVRLTDLPRCTVIAEAAHFHDPPDAARQRDDFVVAGTVVDVLHHHKEEPAGFVFASAEPGKTRQTGFLREDALHCAHSPPVK